MKKWISMTLIMVLAFVFVGCKNEKTPEPNNNVSTISIVASKTTIDIGEELTLSVTVTPSSASKDVTWKSSDDSKVTVDANGKIKGIAAGTADITVTSKVNSSKSAKVTITVNGPSNQADPTSVSVNGPETVGIDNIVNLLATVAPSNASQDVIFSSSDDTIATVDGNGKVTGKSLGVVTITVTVLADSSIYTTIEIEVIENTSLGPTQVVIEGADTVIEGTSILLSASVLPQGVSQNVVWSSIDPVVATVSQDGTVTALKPGTAYIQATSAKDENVFTIYTLTVEEDITVVDYPDLGGYQIKIMGAGHALFEHDPFLDDYQSIDKESKKQAWTDVEELFNVDLAVVAYPDEAPWGPARIDWLNQNAAVGDAQTDIFVSTTEWVKVLVEGGSALDVSSFYAKYGKNQMAPALKVATTYKNGLYALPTSSVASIQVDKGLFYNVDLVERLQLDSPAKLFNEGRWTYSDFSQYVKSAHALLSEGQTVLSGKPAYYYMGMVNAAGVKLADTITLKMNFDHRYAKQTADILRDLFETTGWGTNAWDAAVTTFNEGNSIFQAGEYWFVDTDNRWKPDLWDPSGNSRYGYVPYPYPDDMSKEDTRTVSSGGACYMQAASRQYPAGVSAENVFWAFTEMMLRTGQIMTSDPTFDEEATMIRAASGRLDDPESVNAIVYFKKNKVVFDPLYGILDVHSNIGTALDQVVINGTDYNQVMDSIKSSYETSLIDLYN